MVTNGNKPCCQLNLCDECALMLFSFADVALLWKSTQERDFAGVSGGVRSSRIESTVLREREGAIGNGGRERSAEAQGNISGSLPTAAQFMMVQLLSKACFELKTLEIVVLLNLLVLWCCFFLHPSSPVEYFFSNSLCECKFLRASSNNSQFWHLHSQMKHNGPVLVAAVCNQPKFFE